MKKVYLVPILIVILLIVGAGIWFLSNGQLPEKQNVELANPASVFCVNNGGKLEIRTDSTGGQIGFCFFNNKTECEEWAYFRGECKPAEQTNKSGITGTVTLGPTCPVERIPPDPNCAPKPYATSINISKTGSTRILKTIQSNAEGAFSVSLDSGIYILQAQGGNVLPRCGEVSVEVKNNQYTTTKISCDTGIR